ncbi:MAG: hypothetical protein PSX81_00265 [bacterium]|nr:hypothetical protein [bacterium]
MQGQYAEEVGNWQFAVGKGGRQYAVESNITLRRCSIVITLKLNLKIQLIVKCLAGYDILVL